MVHFFRPQTGFHLVANSEAPAGAGSGSSALAIALIGGLNRLVGDRYDEDGFIGLAANIETTVIKVPAGIQDYYPALYGSVSCIHLRPDGVERERLAVDMDEIDRRFVICYTGEPRLGHKQLGDVQAAHRRQRGSFEISNAYATRLNRCATLCWRTTGAR
jgi:D-glycero-alpha-D-manno-heptose-7-phosphate kinase